MNSVIGEPSYCNYPRSLPRHLATPISYLLNPWSRVLLGKLTGRQRVKKFAEYYVNRRFITAFKIPRHVSLPKPPRSSQYPPHPTSWKSILILSSHLRLGLLSGPFHPRFPTKTLYTSIPSHIRARWPSQFILLDFSNQNIGLGVQIIKLVIM
jgi:hypothetical protein